MRAVDEGDDVGADFVVQQCFGPSRRDPGGGRDEHVAVGDHHPGASLANLDVRLDVGGERPVPVELGLRELHERVGIEPRARDRARWVGTSLEDVPRLRCKQGGADRAELLDAQREELGRTTTRQHLHEQEQLTVLRLQQVRHGRVLDVADRDSSMPVRGHGRVVVERPVLELRGRPGAPEVVARVDEVDRGDVEQEAEARGDVGQRPIDRQVRGRRASARRHDRRRSTAALRSSAGTTAASALGAAPRGGARRRSPVHSSMNIFLNSIASAHPRSA